MRRMSDGVEAALHCALALAALPEGKVLPGKSLAELHGVSESYLLKHLRALTAAGVIDALPGPRGGYRLSRDPGRITLLEIVEAIDGRDPAFACRELRQRIPGGACHSGGPDCFIKTRMLAAEEVWRAALRAQTLADLVEDGERQIDDRNKKAIADFLEAQVR
ncbi:MAG: Rrf2 family transcriptional regulator [Telmatospirillum sp.]|nr:Rrf2 family transcriptional regulator [Telmatospirillum sp.]